MGESLPGRGEVAMPRVPAVRREDLPPGDREVYDQIASSRGAEFARQGPFGVLLHSPVFAGRAAHLGSYVRYEGPMPARHRHLLAMIVASRPLPDHVVGASVLGVGTSGVGSRVPPNRSATISRMVCSMPPIEPSSVMRFPVPSDAK